MVGTYRREKNNAQVGQRGATIAEYVILVSLIAIAVIIIVAVVGVELDDMLNDTLRCIQNHTPDDCQLD